MWLCDYVCVKALRPRQSHGKRKWEVKAQHIIYIDYGNSLLAVIFSLVNYVDDLLDDYLSRWCNFYELKIGKCQLYSFKIRSGLFKKMLMSS